jgi:membrane protein DedA with SNARE-associated domain
MWQDVLQWVTNYGYFAIFIAMMFGIIGLPIPDETILVFTGYLSTRAQLRFELVLASGYAGAISGITASYLIGRYLGYGFLHKYGRWIHLNDEKLQQLHNWYEKYGGWTLVFGYYIAGVRHFSAIVAGTSRLEYPRFALFAYPSAILWVTVFVILGRVLGDHWQEAVRVVHEEVMRISIGLVLVAAAWLLWRWYRAKRSNT